MLECVHRGAPTGELLTCTTCPRKPRLKVFECAKHDECTMDGEAGIASCGTCADREPPPPAATGKTAQLKAAAAKGVKPAELIAMAKKLEAASRKPVVVVQRIGPEAFVTLGASSLKGGDQGKRFNASILRHESDWLLAYRDGWQDSRIWLTRLEPHTFQPIGAPWKLELSHPLEANLGQEDPRLFLHDGSVHVMYVGTLGDPQAKRVLRTSVLIARLSEDLRTVEKITLPLLPDRRLWEKNWGPFEHGGELYAVYTINPHRVIRLEFDGTIGLDLTTPGFPSWAWKGGDPRGGAAPVRVGDEYWSFFHDRAKVGGVQTYRTWLYTFSASPPHAIQRLIREPLLQADAAAMPEGWHANVVFTCGAQRDGDRWILSSGVQDRWIELHAFDHADLESRLVRLVPPPGWKGRGQANEPGVWRYIHWEDEYRIRSLDLRGKAVLDIGAHVGTFAMLAVDRGAAQVDCYEPSPKSFHCLAMNTDKIDEIMPHQAAIGAHEGLGTLHVESEATSDHVEPGAGGLVPILPDDVQIISLDEAIRDCLVGADPSRAELSRIGLLKLDCEGSEFPALASCTLLDKVDAIAGEYHLGPPERAERVLGKNHPYSPEWLRARLTDAGFGSVEVLPPDSNGVGLFFARRK